MFHFPFVCYLILIFLWIFPWFCAAVRNSFGCTSNHHRRFPTRPFRVSMTRRKRGFSCGPVEPMGCYSGDISPNGNIMGLYAIIINMHVIIYNYTYTHTHTHIHIHTYTHTHIYTYTHTHTHIHTLLRFGLRMMNIDLSRLHANGDRIGKELVENKTQNGDSLFNSSHYAGT